MSTNSRKKERHRLKRKQKQLARRRAMSGSPYKRIGTSGDVTACFMNPDYAQRGQAAIFVLRSIPGGGGYALAAFLVDLWCAGLKDAWGKLDITREEFEGMVDQMDKQTPMRSGDLETVRRVVAGGLRFAQQNGFRLPPRFERWTAIIGGVGDWSQADLTHFGVDGGAKLRWVAPLDDLRKRLIGCSVDEFLARADVEFVLGDEQSALLGDNTIEIEEMIQGIQQRALDQVRRWCFANGEQPHPNLADALEVLFEAMMQAQSDDGDIEEEIESPDVSPDLLAAGDANMSRLLALERPDMAQQTREALHQLHRYIEQFDSAEAFMAAIGTGDSD